MNKKIVFEILVHLLLCIFILLFFRLNSFLRPLAIGALYKEYIAGGIVLLVFYLNFFILYPRLYSECRFESYFIVAFASLITSALVEESLVYPQISQLVNGIGINTHRYFTSQTIFVFLRNSCYFLFSFMLCTIRSLKEDKRDLYRHLQDQKHLIVAKDIQGKNNVTLDYEDCDSLI